MARSQLEDIIVIHNQVYGSQPMIRLCTENDADTIYEIVNDSARAYQGRIPDGCYHQPYMPLDELLAEMSDGVVFYGYEQEGDLLAVMGIQDKGPVTLIRHAYTRTESRGQGIGSRLLEHLLALTAKPVLIGTWRDATWAIRFYERFGFRLVSAEEKNRLLKTYWSISQRQVDTSVVLADETYREERFTGGNHGGTDQKPSGVARA